MRIRIDILSTETVQKEPAIHFPWNRIDPDLAMGSQPRFPTRSPIEVQPIKPSRKPTTDLLSVRKLLAGFTG